MPNDFITLKALCRELDKTLSGARLDKISQPERDELFLSVKTADERVCLVAGCNPQNPRLHLTRTKKENPLNAPSFCMSARKRIGGGIIAGVTTPYDDRIASIELRCRNEMNDVSSFYLIIELMGRYSNIILADAGFTVLDCIKRIGFDTASKRSLIPGVKYVPPEVPRVNIADIDKTLSVMRNFDANPALFLQKNVSGVAPETAAEIIALSDYPTGGERIFTETVSEFLDINASPRYAPGVYTKDGASDYFVFRYSSLSGGEWLPTPTLNDAAAYCRQKKDDDARRRERLKPLAAGLKSYVSKHRKKLQNIEEKLAECNYADRYGKTGELILNNLYKYVGGGTLEAVDYETGETVAVPIEGTPQETARKLFKKYSKLKRTQATATEQKKECLLALEYAETIEQSLAQCLTPEDFSDVENELAAIGALKKHGGKERQKSRPLCFEIDGFTVMVGKNNAQNDNLTFKTARGCDVWFHALGYHGSHTVLFSENRSVPESTLVKAAALAAYYSKGRAADKIPVDYTLVKRVKRHPSKALGMAVYTEQKTVFVKPSLP